jgi:hypothetical protein
MSNYYPESSLGQPEILGDRQTLELGDAADLFKNQSGICFVIDSAAIFPDLRPANGFQKEDSR